MSVKMGFKTPQNELSVVQIWKFVFYFGKSTYVDLYKGLAG